MKNTFWKRERIEIMIALALFNYVFLGAEYLFDNMMAFQTDSGGVVLAQSYVLGSSTVGFLLFGILDGKLRERAKKAGSAGAGVLAAVCLWGIQVHQSYGSILAAGLILYVLLGIAGSLVHYRAACRYGMEEHLAETVGVSYATGLFLQFLENNLTHQTSVCSGRYAHFHNRPYDLYFCNIRQCSDIRACRWKYGYRTVAKTDPGGQRTCVRRIV